MNDRIATRGNPLQCLVSSQLGALGAPFVAGQMLYAQGWYREPAAPKQTNLSTGRRFTLCN